jgi:hypothetical protein
VRSRDALLPQPIPDRARVLLEDFERPCDAKPEPAEQRKLILSLFAQVWAKNNQIVAVRPNTASARYFNRSVGGTGYAPKSRRE